MSKNVHHNIEKSNHEQMRTHSPEISHDKPKSQEAKNSHEARHSSDSMEKQARSQVESLSISVEKHKAHEESINGTHEHINHPHHYLTRKVKNGAYHQSIENIQTHLSPAEKKFSRFIHNDTVEKISEIGSKSIARPNAILGGGFIMFLGGLITLFLSKKYGFEIPLSIFLSLYLVGFIIVFVFDLIAQRLKARSRARNNS